MVSQRKWHTEMFKMKTEKKDDLSRNNNLTVTIICLIHLDDKA